MDHEERSWYSVVLTAIHLCRPHEDQLSRQESVLQRSEVGLQDIASNIEQAKQYLSELQDKRDLAAERVQRHHEAMIEVRSTVSDMDA
eukprot:95375-Pyramimonas_sp.AAC.1